MENKFMSLEQNEMMELNGGAALTGWALVKTVAVIAGVGTAGVAVGVVAVVGTVWLLKSINA